MSFISPSQLKEKILEHKELACGVRSEGHLQGPSAICDLDSFGKLELEFRHLIPRLETPIVLCDDARAWWNCRVRLPGSAIHG
ncbi:MAG: hypothetical protein CM1200mP18_21280 [Gammaproteobacteria bacterium]|nr:MAG: hypothetical protein CM1200mP18_21280 [Gammaproteobacteria bacterium]